jgi:hypothetical protein
VLSVCQSKSAAPSQIPNGNGAVVSLAIYEEIELLCSMLSQLFEHADLWAEIDSSTFANVKDYMLFAVPSLLKNQLSSALLPSSVTEQHLAEITCKDRTLLNIKVEMSLIKTMLSCASSLYNVFSLQKQTNI